MCGLRLCGSWCRLFAGNARIEKYHNAGVLCWSGNDDEAHAGRHQHHAQVRITRLACGCSKWKRMPPVDCLSEGHPACLSLCRVSSV